MKYLRKFNTEADVMMFDSPNVVLATDSGKVMYNVPKLQGVYIQHINGAIYTTDVWAAGGFSNEQANGVAVITDACKFVIAKEDVTNEFLPWTNGTWSIPGVLKTNIYAEARADYNGVSNTALIAATCTAGAAYLCANFTFPNGKKGYLGAHGEWHIAKSYKSDIDAAMSLIGGVAIQETYYWSSTIYDSAEAYRYSWNKNSTDDHSRMDYGGSGRAFLAI